MCAECPPVSHVRFLLVSCPCPSCVLEVTHLDGPLSAADQAWPALLSYVYREWNWSPLTLHMSIKCATLSRLSYAGYFRQNFVSSHPHEAVKMKHPLQVPFELVDPEEGRSLALWKGPFSATAFLLQSSWAANVKMLPWQMLSPLRVALSGCKLTVSYGGPAGGLNIVFRVHQAQSKLFSFRNKCIVFTSLIFEEDDTSREP